MHELAQNSTIFELLTEFYEDLFEKDPKMMLEAARGEDGEIVFEETGDPLIDKWERELSQGITPDLTEGLSKRSLEQLEKERIKTEKARTLADAVDDIDEEVLKDPRLASKFVQVGSKEEKDLLKRKFNISEDDIIGNG